MLGVVTGLPLGVLNVSIAEAAAAGRVRFAVQVGIGGALADMVHAALAFGGVGRLLVAKPEWTRVMAVVAAVVIVVYVVSVWRRRRSEPEIEHEHEGRGGLLVGVLLTLPNPAALGAWVAVAAALWPGIALPAAIVLAIGVGLGSATWFAVLARFIAKRPRVGGWVSRIGLLALVAIGAAGIVRAFVL